MPIILLPASETAKITKRYRAEREMECLRKFGDEEYPPKVMFAVEALAEKIHSVVYDGDIKVSLFLCNYFESMKDPNLAIFTHVLTALGYSYEYTLTSGFVNTRVIIKWNVK